MAGRPVTACDSAGAARLDQLIDQAARTPPSRLAPLRQQLGVLLEAEAAGGPADLAALEAAFRKWQLVHRLVRAAPFRDRAGVPRSRQWRAALDRVRALREPELIDWVCLQAEIAGNIERGVQEMRPRKGGPTCLVLLEHVANRKRKALAVLHWARAAARDGPADGGGRDADRGAERAAPRYAG